MNAPVEPSRGPQKHAARVAKHVVFVGNAPVKQNAASQADPFPFNLYPVTLKTNALCFPNHLDMYALTCFVSFPFPFLSQHKSLSLFFRPRSSTQG